MHCPKCGQQQVSDETRFCSRCGFLLSGVYELVANNGVGPAVTKRRSNSPRRRGLSQGLFIFLLAFLVVPVVIVITIGLGIEEPYAAVLSAIILTVGGILRMVYALLFQSPEDGFPTIEEKSPASTKLKGAYAATALPPQHDVPISDYTSPTAGRWRETSELLKQTSSVTDSTTKLLEKEPGD